jgi:hypothetical protein
MKEDDENGNEFKGINSQNIRDWNLKKENNHPCLIHNLIGHILNPLKATMISTMNNTYDRRKEKEESKILSLMKSSTSKEVLEVSSDEL